MSYFVLFNREVVATTLINISKDDIATLKLDILAENYLIDVDIFAAIEHGGDNNVVDELGYISRRWHVAALATSKGDIMGEVAGKGAKACYDKFLRPNGRVTKASTHIKAYELALDETKVIDPKDFADSLAGVSLHPAFYDSLEDNPNPIAPLVKQWMDSWACFTVIGDSGDYRIERPQDNLDAIAILAAFSLMVRKGDNDYTIPVGHGFAQQLSNARRRSTPYHIAA